MNVTIDETIERIEQLYATLTGTSPPTPNGSSVRIPPETDPGQHVEKQLRQLLSAMDRFGVREPTAPAWIPRAIVTADRVALEIALDVPGVSRDDVQIVLEDRVLTITGQREVAPAVREDRRIETCELALGTFTRAFELPVHVAPENVIAHLAGGVLTIRIAASARNESSQIPIRS
jgi:HSP20 family protein